MQGIHLCNRTKIVALLPEIGDHIGQGLDGLTCCFCIMQQDDTGVLTISSVKSTLLRWVLKFAVFNAGTVLVYLLLFALLGPAVLDELLADGIGMLAALLAAGNLSFWLCDRALAALTRYYHVILKPKLKKKF